MGGLDNQLLICRFLRRAGLHVEVASNGRIALQMLEKSRSYCLNRKPEYDLLLTDMQMPEMDGYTLARTLCAQGCPIPIVALTAHAMDEDRQKCVLAGCDDYLTKPVKKADLLAICSVWLGRESNLVPSELLPS